MPHIYILFSTFPDPLSRFFHFAGGLKYTHASLSLEEDPDTYYSFNLKGFAVETREKFHRRNILGNLRYQLAVSPQAYQSIRRRMDAFRANRERYQYNLPGAILCIFHCPICWNRHYFCSHFVAETLRKTKAVRLKGSPYRYLPSHLQWELMSLPQLRAVQANII